MLTDNTYAQSEAIWGTHPVRASPAVRRFLQRDPIQPSDIVAALLVAEEKPSSSDLPIIAESELAATSKAVADLGIRAVKIFVTSTDKDDRGQTSLREDGLHLRAIRSVKAAMPSLCVITDSCLCSFTQTGDCVLLDDRGQPQLANTLDLLAEQCVLQIAAGADIIGPAAMLGGAVKAIRARIGDTIPIMPHLTWRSALFRPYRKAMATGCGDQRQAFQIDPMWPEFYLQMAEDMVSEGANMLMCQPSLFSLDAIATVKDVTGVPVGAYSVSGEYRMFRSLGSSDQDFFDILYEHATAAKRSGVSFIVTYAWRELLEGRKRFVSL